MAADKAVVAMIEAARRVFYNKWHVTLYAGGEKFRVRSAELSDDGQVILCEAPDDDAEITIRASALDAVKEIVDSYA